MGTGWGSVAAAQLAIQGCPAVPGSLPPLAAAPAALKPVEICSSHPAHTHPPVHPPVTRTHPPTCSPAGLEALSAKVTEVRARLQERIAEVVRRQEELMGAQGEMAAQLAGVGRDVEHTRGQVGQVGAGHVSCLPACCLLPCGAVGRAVTKGLQHQAAATCH
jgi:hypothetical protein